MIFSKKINKNIIVSVAIIFLCGIVTFGKEIEVIGTVVCKSTKKQSRPISNVIIYPSKKQSVVVPTAANGVFTFTMSLSDVYNRVLEFCFENCKGEKKTKNRLISGEYIEGNRAKIKDLEIDWDCDELEGADTDSINKRVEFLKIDGELKELAEKFKKDKKKIKIPIIGISIPVAGVSIFTLMVLKKKTIIKEEIISLDNFIISPEKSEHGRFIDFNYLEFSQNIGFSFTPFRNLNEAVFWNPSAIMFASKNQINFHTDYKGNYRLSAFSAKNDKLRFGLGVYLYNPGERRTATLNSIEVAKNKFHSGELLISSSVAFRAKRNLFFSAAFKLINQSIKTPSAMKKSTYSIDNKNNTEVKYSILSDRINHTYLDSDLSATLRICNFLKLGLSLMNVFGTKLQTTTDNFHNQQSLGIGLSLSQNRFNFGSEIRLNREDKSDISLGVNFIPFDRTLINIGYIPTSKVYSVGLNYGNFYFSIIKKDNGKISPQLGSTLFF